MSSVIDTIERGQLKKGLPSFDAGDRVRVHFQVIEGSRRRTQVFEGIVLKRQGSGARETFTVRKQSFGVGVERTFPLHSPKIEKLEIAARGDVRRAKLYYLRGRIGKAARVAERRWGIDEELIGATPAAGDEPEALDAEGISQTEAAADESPEAEDAGSDVEDAGTDGEETTAAGENAEAEGEDSTAQGEDTSEEQPQSEDSAPSEEQPHGEQGEADPPAAEAEPSKPADGQDSD